MFGSGVVFYLQSWCISARGPLYSAMFTPLCTVLTTALSAVILHEELHIGRHVSFSEQQTPKAFFLCFVIRKIESAPESFDNR